FFGSRLLRGHIGQRSQGAAGSRQMVSVYFLCRERFRTPWGAFLQAHLGKTKVENLGLAVFRDENVGGGDVAMDDALGVCSVDPFCNLDGHAQKSFDSHRLASDTVLQGRSIKKLHYDECLPVLLADIVNGANVGVVQGRSGPRLTLEASQSMRASL